MDGQDLFDQIEAYILNQLSPTEKLDFEGQMKKNPALKERVTLQLLEHDMMEVLREKDLKHKMQHWQKELPPVKKSNKNLYLLGGTLLIIFVLFGIWWWSLNQPPSNNQDQPIIENNSPPEPEENIQEVPVEKEVPTENDTNIEEEKVPPPPVAEVETSKPKEPNYLALATSLYDSPELVSTQFRGNQSAQNLQQYFTEGDYNAVLSILKETPDNNLEAQKIKGHAAFRIKNYQTAAQAFEKIINSDDPALAEEIAFYFLLSLLAIDEQETPSFQNVLNSILSDPEHKDYEITKENLARFLMSE